MQKIIDRASEPDLAPNEPNNQITPATFKRRVDAYESVSEGFVKVCGLVGVWGDAADLRLVTEAIQTLWTALQPSMGGLSVYLDMRGYIPVLAGHACSLGMIKASRWREYRDFLRVEAPGDRNSETNFLTDLNTVRWKGNHKQLWNMEFAPQNHHAPFADHLYAYFESSVRDFLGIVPDFTALYLLSEVLPTIAWVDGYSLKNLTDKLAENGGHNGAHIWVPVFGRMGWDQWPMERLLKRVDSEKFAFDLAAGGFGGGKVDVVKAAVINMKRVLANVHWW